MSYLRRNGARRDGRIANTSAFRYARLVILAGVLAGPLPAQTVTLPQPNVTYASGAKDKIYGAIVSRQGDDMLVRQENSDRIGVVTLTDNTVIESPSGVLNVAKKHQDVTLLVPGLYVKVRGAGGSRGNLVAERISFHKTALKVANQISAGEVDLRSQVAANYDSIEAIKARARDSLSAFHDRLAARMSEMDAYDVNFNGIVHFATGSAELTSSAKATLDSLASAGMGLRGYLIEVAGFADSRGTERFNQHLSERRVTSVVQYLAERNVPLRRMVNPTGMGESNPTSPNDTEKGRA